MFPGTNGSLSLTWRQVSDLPVVCTRFHDAIELIGARWSGAVIDAVFRGNHRFAEIKAAIPAISDTMLSQRLHELESAGLLQRKVSDCSPVRVEYVLTEKGAELKPVHESVMTWAHKWMPLPAGTTDPDD